jgi:hypothetical protein
MYNFSIIFQSSSLISPPPSLSHTHAHRACPFFPVHSCLWTEQAEWCGRWATRGAGTRRNTTNWNKCWWWLKLEHPQEKGVTHVFTGAPKGAERVSPSPLTNIVLLSACWHISQYPVVAETDKPVLPSVLWQMGQRTPYLPPLLMWQILGFQCHLIRPVISIKISDFSW